MPGPIEHLPCIDSPLSRFDPRWKLAALLLAGIGVITLHSLPTATLAFCTAVVLAIVGRLPPRWCLARLGAVLLVLMPFLVILPLVHRDPEPVAQIGPLQFSLEGARLALVLALKTLSLVLL